jgi:hypothetical protein
MASKLFISRSLNGMPPSFYCAHFKIHTLRLLFIVNVYNKISFNKNVKRTVHRRNVILGECQVEQTYVM